MENRFIICKHCGNIVEKIKDSGAALWCCGEQMTEIVPGVTDGAAEKHVPVARTEGNAVTVTVGTAPHPMLPAHFIEWIVLETVQGVQRKKLAPNTEPKATFALCEGDAVVAAYAYCNLHSLWKA